ncbi:hypothetical protein A2V82_02710 [candidate division KSB1 bacterium RBG_16_48_16]|nr:MAG: hypothetical protein A2V82_02710 [candidate division KSB1 bacterium RBG_16_48_16]
MNKWLQFIIHTLWIAFFLTTMVAAQGMEGLHGDQNYSYRGIYEGNQIRTPFYNDGMIGSRYEIHPDDFKTNWPVGSSLGYITNLIPFIGAEVVDMNGVVRHIMSETHGCRVGVSGDGISADVDEFGNWRSLAPLPGFANDELQEVAMSHKRGTWPAYWPDKMNQADPGWPGSWNGYFGKNQFSADQESYFVLDDYLNDEFPFYPDATDSSRRGLGVRGYVRGMQWNNILVEDVLFSIYDFENIGTHNHDKMVFGMLSGPDMGSTVAAGVWLESDDDGGEFDLDLNLGWHTDQDWISFDGSPIGLYGVGFFETPGNPYDGIDNDGDGANGSGPVITEAMFAPITYQIGAQVIKINYQTFERTIETMDADGIDIVYLNKVYTFLPNTPLEEIANNLIDDNLNGIIDETNGSELTDENGVFIRSVWLFTGKKYIDYFTGSGLDNPLIDERRDDGIDNDGDWDIENDDTGLDGVPFTGDVGEGDGVPSPGEKHFDALDISESDMIGLTTFNIFTPWNLYPIYEDEILWGSVLPGIFNSRGQFGNTDIMLGSGYFPLQAGETNRFSLGIIFGEGPEPDDLIRNKNWADEAYLNNYEFAKAPAVPTLTARAGDNKVTLYWDSIAEESEDPVLGKDFEGYRIYRSTSDEWGDMKGITDMWGSLTFRKPIAQFDLVNGIQGKFPLDVKGVYYDLGTDNGIVHTWTDYTAKNGFNYFYAVTAYDHGDLASGLPPSECSYVLSIRPDGTVVTGPNVVQIRPEPPAAGFVGPTISGRWLESSAATGEVQVEIADEFKTIEATYQVTFGEMLVDAGSGLYPTTQNFSLINITKPLQPDTLLNKQAIPTADVLLPTINGIRLYLSNELNNTVSLNTDLSQWNRDNINPFNFVPFRNARIKGVAKSSDYRLEFYDQAGVDISTAFNDGTRDYPEVAVNFKVFNQTEEKQIDFAFRERDGEDGFFSAYSDEAARYSDEIYLLESNENDSLIATWRLTLSRTTDTTSTSPRGGDFLNLVINKPFLKNDVYQFSTISAHFDREEAEYDLNNIYVVPNPYIVANAWEPENNFLTGRGPRELHFINLPPQCTITIYNVRGQMIAKLDHNESIWNGTEIWNMQTKDQLDIAYGLYIYHIETPDIGEKVGKFAVIK